jgi:OOP family OmpA-OmpF porin
MRKPAHLSSLLLIVAVLMVACATSYEPVPPFTPVKVDAGGRLLKSQNALIILDASSSMAEGYRQHKKFDIATAVVRNMAQSIPADMGLKAGLRIFGGDPNTFKNSTHLIDEMDDFDMIAYEKALDSVTGPGGPSPMPAAIAALLNDLEGVDGRTAIIFVSDGKGMGTVPGANAMVIKEKFGDSVCYHPVLVGDDPEGAQLMDALAKLGGCGFAVSADDLANGRQMAEYVTKVFIGERLDSDGDGVTDAMDQCPGTPAGITVDAAGCPLDSDEDGVPDYQDQCPDTPVGVKVDANGCPLDSDGDGVPDSLDQCPRTPSGVKVDANGCPVTILGAGAAAWAFNDINFETGKADIQPASYSILNEIATALGANPQLNVVVEGHTDSTGARSFNMDLSQRRAQAVVDYLVGKGVSPSRLSAKGYGPDRPIADNDTRLGRSKNRRVQFTRVD